MDYEDLAGLELEIDSYGWEAHERDTSSDFIRRSTVVSMHGAGKTGRGEDVTYDASAHESFGAVLEALPAPGTYTLEAYSRALAGRDLFPGSEPEQSVYRSYRRWAVESAALDLGLRQADTSLAERLGRSYDPVRFVVSTPLEDPPTGEVIQDWLHRHPDLEFKLDPDPDWTAAVVERLADTGAVRILDLKGLYEGTDVDQPADPAFYRRIVEGFPEAFIEDPDLTEKTRPLFAGQTGRVTWDYPIQDVESIEALPWEPDWLNCKPSRFGSVRSLFETIEYCREHDIQLYGGGQYELDVGREHIHAIASLYYPSAPNDVAPTGYNDPDPSGELPTSPLEPPEEPRGLSWG